MKFNKIIGMDFSIKKPAACVYDGRDYSFISWPHDLSDKIVGLMRNSGINVVPRSDIRTQDANVSEKMRNEVKNSIYLAKLICESLSEHLDDKTVLAFEGLSYGSNGDATLQLSSYKYVLMSELSKLVPFQNMFTYSPITVKSVAKCSKKGMTKADVIESFLINSEEKKFTNAVRNNVNMFKKKNSSNWIDHLDDVVDSYWIVKTLLEKENAFLV